MQEVSELEKYKRRWSEWGHHIMFWEEKRSRYQSSFQIENKSYEQNIGFHCHVRYRSWYLLGEDSDIVWEYCWYLSNIQLLEYFWATWSWAKAILLALTLGDTWWWHWCVDKNTQNSNYRKHHWYQKIRIILVLGWKDLHWQFVWYVQLLSLFMDKEAFPDISGIFLPTPTLCRLNEIPQYISYFTPATSKSSIPLTCIAFCDLSTSILTRRCKSLIWRSNSGESDVYSE